jgi:hypothetical protein
MVRRRAEFLLSTMLQRIPTPVLGNFLRAVFKEVLWERRSQVLYPSQDYSRTGEDFFKTYRACVLTLRNAPEWPLLKELLDLNLQDLVDTTYADIISRWAFLAQCNAPRLGSILKR